eukprot:5164869-Pyramimonas_sp.AAC.1
MGTTAAHEQTHDARLGALGMRSASPHGGYDRTPRIRAPASSSVPVRMAAATAAATCPGPPPSTAPALPARRCRQRATQGGR